MMRFSMFLTLGFLALGISGCFGDDDRGGFGGSNTGLSTTGPCSGNATKCAGSEAYVCIAGEWRLNADCYDDGDLCGELTEGVFGCRYYSERQDCEQWIPEDEDTDAVPNTNEGKTRCYGDEIEVCNGYQWQYHSDCGAYDLDCQIIGADAQCVTPSGGGTNDGAGTGGTAGGGGSGGSSSNQTFCEGACEERYWCFANMSCAEYAPEAQCIDECIEIMAEVPDLGEDLFGMDCLQLTTSECADGYYFDQCGCPQEYDDCPLGLDCAPLSDGYGGGVCVDEDSWDAPSSAWACEYAWDCRADEVCIGVDGGGRCLRACDAR